MSNEETYAEVMGVNTTPGYLMTSHPEHGVETFVLSEDYRSLRDAYCRLREAISLAHADIVYDGIAARKIIEIATGLNENDARAMQGRLLARKGAPDRAE